MTIATMMGSRFIHGQELVGAASSKRVCSSMLRRAGTKEGGANLEFARAGISA